MEVHRIAVLNDLHIPFEDTKAVELTLAALKGCAGLTEIVINGDLLDMYGVNMHGPKHPDVQETLEDELLKGKYFLERLRSLFDCKITFIFGNHEDRLDRFILKNCKPFTNILKIEAMLDLDKLDIDYYYYNHAYQILDTRLYVQHSPPSYGVNGARTSLTKKPYVSFIYGCTHRKQMSSITNYDGSVSEVWYNGWLGSTAQSEQHARVFSYAKGHENWQQCFSIVTVLDRKEFHIQQIPITREGEAYRCIVDGYLYEE